MQKLALIPLLLFIFISSFSQSITVQFDNLPINSTGTPYYPVYEYTYGQAIYLENDIQGGGKITGLTFYYNGIGLDSRNVTVYLGTTWVDHMDSIKSFKSTTLFKVFQGTITNYATPGNVMITLDSAYSYNDSNLVIAINETTPGNDTSLSDHFLGYYPGIHNRGLTWATSGVPWDLYYFDMGQFSTYGGGVPKVTLHGLTRFPCQSPKYVHFDRIVHDGARINWSPPDSGTTPTGYDIYYSTSRYKPSSAISTPYTTVDSFYIFTGLASSTWYYAWVRSRSATCTSVWTVVDSFKTTCSPALAPTLVEPFKKPFPPNCWERAFGKLANPTKFLNFGPNPYHYWQGAPYRDVAGTDSAAKAFIRTDTLRHWLISPPYDLGSAGNKSLEFDAAFTKNGSPSQQGYFDADDKFVVIISTDEGITWSSANTLRAWTSPQIISSAGVHYILPLSAYTGLVRIGFYIESTSGNPAGSNIPTLFIDNVKVSESLPVTLLEFSGTKESLANLLQWRTATEQSNRGFELQKSANGIDFSSIAFVPTKAGSGGNSTALLSYSYSDTKPFTGNNYYRLKQIDFDGKATLSNVVLVKGSRGNELMLSAIYPNPTSKTLHVVINAPTPQTAQLLITDLAGRSVRQQTINLQSGDNNLDVNVSTLAKGVYILKVICGDGCEAAVSKFVKE